MKKRIVLASGVSLLTSVCLTFAVLIQNTETKISKTSGIDTYDIVINPTTQVVDGRISYRTATGATIYFDVDGFTPSNDGLTFGTFAVGGYIKNPYMNITNNNYIGGITNMSLDLEGGFSVDYTWGESLTAGTPYYQRRGYVVNSTADPNKVFSFLSETPNFICLTATESTLVTSITITYKCVRGEERGDNLKINSASLFERFKTVVNRGNSFEGQVVELTKDIDLGDLTAGDKNWAIGTSEELAFKGTFNGNSHTISNFNYSKTEVNQVALFAHCYGATIRNLKLVNFNITLTKNRAAALISRAEAGCLVENVELVSGNIAGTSESGGLVGVSINGITIHNCINRAQLNSSGNGGGAVGGIIGYANSGATNIDECYNYGTIYGSGIGVGGIMGVTAESTSVILDMNNCHNYGNVFGKENVGGIAGLPRGSNTSSIVRNCANYGNVSSSISAGYVGGIVGRARVIIDNCSCAGDVTLTLNGTPYTANNLSRYSGSGSTPGYIAATQESSGKNHGEVRENCSLVNENIGAFTTYEVNDKGPEFTNGRIVKLQNNNYLLTAVSGYSISNNLGANAFADFKVRTNSYGWDYIPGTDKQILSANFCPLVLPDGRIAIFYRTNPTLYNGSYYSSIRAIISSDYGANWTRYYLFENYSSEGSGAYEPFGVLDGDIIHVYFACDIRSTRTNGLGPDNSAFVETFDSSGMLYQNILRLPIDISNGGFSIGQTTMCIEATDQYRRPGMPTVVRLLDGSYAMAIEHCGSKQTFSDYAMIIALSYSTDLVNWTAPQTIITPNYAGIKNGNNNLYRCGAPVIQLFPSGKIAISYMTNEYYYGYECENVGGTDSWFRTQEIAVSSDVVTYGSVPEMTRLTGVREYGENIGSCYGGCAIIDGKLIMISNNYTITSSGSRTKNSGLLFSTASIY